METFPQPFRQPPFISLSAHKLCATLGHYDVEMWNLLARVHAQKSGMPIMQPPERILNMFSGPFLFRCCCCCCWTGLEELGWSGVGCGLGN